MSLRRIRKKKIKRLDERFIDFFYLVLVVVTFGVTVASKIKLLNVLSCSKEALWMYIWKIDYSIKKLSHLPSSIRQSVNSHSIVYLGKVAIYLIVNAAVQIYSCFAIIKD